MLLLHELPRRGRAAPARRGARRGRLDLAAKLRRDGRSVMPEDIARARAAGADDKAIHDTVLVAAAFCMYNRYVDGLATWCPHDAGMYDKIGEKLAARGYRTSVPAK